MHIPDGLMSPIIFTIGWVLAIIALAVSVWAVNRKVDRRQIPLMGVLAAGIFVAQMLNFPIGGGTTGHLVGAAMAAVFLGPYAAILVITVILVIQCLLFGDGGVTALGLNIFNMAVIGCFVGWYVHRLFPKKARKVGIFIAAWAAVFIGSFACAGELALSYSLSGGAYGISATLAFPAMLAYHTLIGVGEGFITTAVVAFVAVVSPEMLKMPKIMLRSILEEVPGDA